MRKQDLRFQLGRSWGILRIMLRNKLALVGLVLLLGSIFLAVGAPLLTPYDPKTSVVSGPLAQPAWVMNFPDGYYLSQNLVVVPDPVFTSASAVQDWTLDPSSGVQSNLLMSYAPRISSPGLSQAAGSLQLAYLGSGPLNASISRTFDFPYNGPPQRFVGSIFVRVSNASPGMTVHVSLFINRLGDRIFDLWDKQISVSDGWVQPGYNGGLSSSSLDLQQFLGMTGATPLGPASIIFSNRQEYSYGLQISFNGPATVNVDNVQLQLYGTAWGVLGTDANGNDLLTQLIYGARVSLIVGLIAAGIGIGVGLVVGLLAGFLGKIVDELLMRFTDMVLVIPFLPLLLILITVLGPSITNTILVIGFFSWMGFARIVRSQVITLKERPFVEAARAAGSGTMRIISRHIFPNIVSLTYVNLALTVPGAILTEAALSFLGLGDPDVVSWGWMFNNAENANALFDWWWVLPPGLMIAVVSLSFVLIGYSLDEIFNPRLRRRT